MHISSRKRLREFSEKHPDAKPELDAWFKVAKKAEWRSIIDVRHIYQHADPVGTRTVFNIRRNRFRLIVKIEYRIQRIYIKRVLTHADYDRGE